MSWTDLRMRIILDHTVAEVELAAAVDKWIDIACPRWYIHQEWAWSRPRRAGLSPLIQQTNDYPSKPFTMAAIEEFRRTIAEGRVRHGNQPWRLAPASYYGPVVAGFDGSDQGKVMFIDSRGRMFAATDQDQTSKVDDLMRMMDRWRSGLAGWLFAPTPKSVAPQQFPRA